MNPEDTLQAWRQREAEVRQRSCGPGVAQRADYADRTGLQAFQAMLAGELPGAPIGQTMGFCLVEAEDGRVAFQGQPRFEHYNPLGTVHGGWVATLLDSAVGCAVHTRLPRGKAYTTVELKVNYTRALTDKVPLVRALGEIIHQGSRIATAQGRLVGPDGTLYAHASTTCLIFDAPTP